MKNNLKHIAIIMDGNGRWAQKKGMIRSLGHKKGASTLEKLALHINDLKIEYLCVYAFSTDNFKRSKEEVDYLMNLFIEMFNKKFKKLQSKGIKVVFSGDKNGLREDVIKAMDNITKETENNNGSVLNICLNYGSQEEIIRAANRYHNDLINNKVSINDINRDNFYKYMDNDLPPIDLVIRTSGEYRISNFMLWQMAYSELYFTNTYFPDFKEKEFEKAIMEFENRHRRFGREE